MIKKFPARAFFCLAGLILLSACSDTPVGPIDFGKEPSYPSAALTQLASEANNAVAVFLPAPSSPTLSADLRREFTNLTSNLDKGLLASSRLDIVQVRYLLSTADAVARVELAPVSLALDHIEKAVVALTGRPITAN